MMMNQKVNLMKKIIQQKLIKRINHKIKIIIKFLMIYNLIQIHLICLIRINNNKNQIKKIKKLNHQNLKMMIMKQNKKMMKMKKKFNK